MRDLIIPDRLLPARPARDEIEDGRFRRRVRRDAVLVFALFEYFVARRVHQVFQRREILYRARHHGGEARPCNRPTFSSAACARPAPQGGRNLLSFLGDHRVSSVFLEPVSFGNFGVIVSMIGMVRSKFGDKCSSACCGRLALIVLPDSRFGAYLCILALVIMLLPIQLATLGTVALPLIALAMLTLVPMIVTGSYDPQNRYVDNGFVGRFVLSGQILGDFDVLTWLGLKALADRRLRFRLRLHYRRHRHCRSAGRMGHRLFDQRPRSAVRYLPQHDGAVLRDDPVRQQLAVHDQDGEPGVVPPWGRGLARPQQHVLQPEGRKPRIFPHPGMIRRSGRIPRRRVALNGGMGAAGLKTRGPATPDAGGKPR